MKPKNEIETVYVEMTREKLKKLKKAYKTAKDSGAEVFMFEGSEVVVTYAKYMIEYCEMRLRDS